MARAGSNAVVTSLRALMKDARYVPSSISAYIVPSEDAHQSEYIASCDERRAFISGFSGSRGMAIVTEKDAGMWTDGRYFIQAERQLGPDWTLMREGVGDTPTPSQWLSKTLHYGDFVGVDPSLISHSLFDQFRTSLSDDGIKLIGVTQNLVDLVWGSDRPPMPKKPIISLDVKFSGATTDEKLSKIRDRMKEERCGILVISALDEVAWLFNLRGSDIDYNPVFFSYAIVTMDGAHLFTDPDRLGKAAKASLGKRIKVSPYSAIGEELQKLCNSQADNGTANEKNDTSEDRLSKVWVPASTSEALVDLVPSHMRCTHSSPLQLLKAVKNKVELDGMRYAHVKDAVAHCQFLQWIEEVMCKGNKDGLTEIGAADKFLELRKVQRDFMGLSFPTISATAGHAAIPHYQPAPETDLVISPKEIYLVDSGSQFRDGTTDVTRTLAFQTPSAYHKECYTRVLKGHITLSRLIFPEKTSGYRLDCFARQSLWDVGRDYRHGTGHGVGHFLNVHEGPSGFHFRAGASTEGILAGMCITIEPGYYEAEKFGIRIENVCIMVEKIPAGKSAPDSPSFLGSEPITLVPLDKGLIEAKLLTQDEVDWINQYHATVLRVVGEELQAQGQQCLLPWLEKRCAPLDL